MHRGSIAVVLKGYPRLSETFIAQELLALERAGLDLALYSLRHPTESARHPVHDEIVAPVVYLPEYLHEEPGRVLGGMVQAVRLPGFANAIGQFIRDLARDPSRNRVRRFGQAMVLAAELPDKIAHIYAHFIHTPASVARYAADMRGLSWSCSAHAKDIWTIPDWEIAEKVASAEWVVTCNRAGAGRLAMLAVDRSRVTLAYHGIDLARFAPFARPDAARDGGDGEHPVRILTVGRAVEKKGLDTVIDALAALPNSLHWCWTQIGGGPLLADLMERAKRSGLGDRVTFRGALPQAEVLAAYRAADLFVLPCRIAADGDRDGLPNALVEAQSQGLACIASNIAGVPELIEDGHNGLLVAPNDVAGLADAMARLIADPPTRAEYGQAGEHRVRRDFDSRREIAGLLRLFGIEGGADATADKTAGARADAGGRDLVA